MKLKNYVNCQSGLIEVCSASSNRKKFFNVKFETNESVKCGLSDYSDCGLGLELDGLQDAV